MSAIKSYDAQLNALQALTIGQLLALHNQHADRVLKCFKDKPTAVARVIKLVTDHKWYVYNDAGTVTIGGPQDDAKPTATGKRGPAPSVDDAATITVLATANPRRAETNRYKRFALYRTGMTVGEYITAAHKLLGFSHARWRRDITRDVAAGLISLDRNINKAGQ